MIAIVHAFNEYMAEEYCTVDPDRLIAMAVYPTSASKKTFAEMRTAERPRFQGPWFSTYPSGKGFPCPSASGGGLDMDMRSLCTRRFPRMSVPGNADVQVPT